MLFSVDYPYEQMTSAARWFDELLMAKEVKLRVGRENAMTLLKLAVGASSASSAVGFGS